MCRACCTIAAGEYRRRNSEKYNETQRRYRKAKRDKDPEKFHAENRARNKRWRDASRDKVVAHRLKSLRKYRYGLSLEEYTKLVEKQEGRCAICHQVPKRSLQVDHDHRTNTIRGLLCVNCNRGLGYLMDNPDIIDAAAQYLRENGGGYGVPSVACGR